MASVSRESIGKLHDKITVKLDKQDYLPDFEKEIKSYSKKANIPGFRKGMVPAGMIKKMYGQDIYRDAVIKSAEKELSNYLINEKIDLFGQPLIINEDNTLPELNLQNPEEYEFLFEIGVRPEIEINIPENVHETFYKVQVKPEDIDQRIENFQIQFGELKETEIIAGPENVINVTITQTDDEGNIKENGFSGETAVYVKVFADEFQEQLKGKKKDDTLNAVLKDIIDPEKYPGVYENLKINAENEELAGSKVQVKIDKVNDLEKSPLNEELFKKAFPAKEIKSEEVFRKAVEEDEQKYWDDTANNQLEHSLYHALTRIPVELPEDFLKKIMNDPSKPPRSAEEIEKEFPSFANQLRWSLISHQIIKDNDLRVTAEEIREEIRSELQQYFGSMDLNSGDTGWIDGYIDRMMADPKQIEQRQDKLTGKKIFAWAKSKFDIQEQEISQEDFKKVLEEHQHSH